VELVQRVTKEIIETGTVEHSFIGIVGTDHVIDTADGALMPGGAEISELWEEYSAAGDAGFLPGDAIVEVEGVQISTMEDLVIQLRLFHVGDEILVTASRDGSPLTAAVILDERPQDSLPPADEETPGDG
jgi:S1-C subfamily serine protease